MTARPRRTTTLVGPNRVVLAAATAGLVALASAGTALLVLTGTSSVAPVAAPAPPLPTSTPLTRAPGVVVLPSDDAGRLTGGVPRPPHVHQVAQPEPVVRVPVVVPPVLAFTDEPAPPVPPVVAPPVVAPPVAPPPPAVRRSPAPDVDVTPEHHGRHLAKGHAKHEKHEKKLKHNKHEKRHGKRVGWSHSEHRGND